MTEPFSIRLDANTKKRLEMEAEEWQLGEIGAGRADLDEGQSVSHEKVSKMAQVMGKAV